MSVVGTVAIIGTVVSAGVSIYNSVKDNKRKNEMQDKMSLLSLSIQTLMKIKQTFLKV